MSKSTEITTAKYFNNPVMVKRFEQILDKNAGGFIASLISIVNNSDQLQRCNKLEILAAATKAASLKLPIEPNLGFAYIIPFKNTKKDKYEAQFQIGYKGFIQLALRSGQIKRLNALAIYEGQLISFDPLTEKLDFDFDKKESQKLIGFACYLELINGFNKTVYWPAENMNKHALRYSQAFKAGFGPWKDDFEKMGLKTVIKNVLSKFAPLSTDLQEGIKFDQSVINENDDPEYIDHEEDKIEIPEDASAKVVKDQKDLFNEKK